jgi:glucose-1-phosphate adenylyltransferase
MDFRKIIQQHMDTGADVTIAATPFPVSKVEGLGLTRVNDDLSIAEFVEKPKDPAVINSLALSPALEAKLQQAVAGEKQCLASMGIYVFNRTALAESLDNSMTDFGKEVIPGLLGKKKLYAHIFEGYWEDIGTVKAFFDANLALAQPLPPFNFFDAKDPIYTKDNYLPASKINNCAIDYVVIGDGSIVEDSSLKHCVLGIRSFVRQGTTLQDVVMMGSDFYETPEQLEANVSQGRPHLGLGRNCKIRGAIIDKNSRIGDDVTLTAEGKPDGTYAHGVVVRDGVLLVPKGGVVPGGTVI